MVFLIHTAASWLFDTSARLAVVAISLAFLVNHVYDMIAWATALHAYSIVNPFGPSMYVGGVNVNVFHDAGRNAAYAIIDVFYPSPFSW